MSQKIRIIRALANPTRTRKARRKKSKLRSARTRPALYVVRLVENHKGHLRALWWTGSSFASQRNRAKRCPLTQCKTVLRSKAFKDRLPKNYVVADVLPAKLLPYHPT